MSAFEGLRADIVWNANTGTAIAELGEVGGVYARTTGAMSDEALRLAAVQERLNKAIARSGPESTAAKSATLAYRREVAALAAEERVAAGAIERTNLQTQHAGRTRRSHLQNEERAAGRFGRGATAGLLSGVGGRALAFGSTAFIGGIGVEYALRAVTKAAEEHQVVEHQLEAAMKAAGLSFDQYGRQVDEALGKQRALTGFTEEDTTRSFIRLVRTTKDVGSALRYNAEAADIARGANISLDSASKIVVKALAGQTTGLRRLGVDLPKGVDGYRALQIAQQKFAGASAAYANTAAGAQARLSNAIHTTEITIGTALLPTITKLSGSLATWLSNSRNQAKIQHDGNAAVRVGGKAAHELGVGIKFAADHGKELKLLLEILIGLKVASVISRWGTSVALFSRNLRGATVVAQEAAAAGGIASAETAIAQTGTAAVTSRTQIRGLRGSLIGLSALQLAPIIIPIAIELQKGIKGKIGDVLGGDAASIYDDVTGFLTGGVAGNDPVSNFVASLFGGGKKKTPDVSGDSAITGGQGQHGALKTNAERRAAARAASRSGAGPAPLDRLTQINLDVSAAQTAISRGDKGGQEALVKALKEQIDYDRKYEKIQEDLERTDVKHRAEHAKILIGLRSDEQGALGQIASIEDAKAAAAKTAHDKAAAAAAEAARKGSQAHLGALAKQESGLESDITGAQTAEQNAKTIHGLTLAEQRERHARTLLLAFYEREEHDSKLTAQKRASARKSAARERLEIARLGTRDDRGALLKDAVSAATNAVLAATEGSTAYTKAVAAEKRALAAEIAYYDKRAHNAKLTVTAKRSAVAAEIAARRQLAALDKKSATSGSDSRAERDQFLSDVQRIIGAYAPNAFPVADPHTGKIATHGYEQVNELRQIKAHLRTAVTRNQFPASSFDHASTQAVFG